MTCCQALCDASTLLVAGDRWRIALHTSEEAFARLGPEWDRLVASSDMDHFFAQHAWQQVWWKHFGDDYMFRVLTVRDTTGRLAGVAPLMARRADRGMTIEFLGGSEVADYMDLIVDRDYAEEVRPALLAAVSAHLEWQTLDLHGLQEHSPTRRAVVDLFSGRGIAVDVEVEDVCPAVQLHGSWDGYLASLGKKDRHELRRKLRRAVADQAATWHTVRAAEGLDKNVSAFVALHRRSSPEKAAFMTAQMEGYFRDLAGVALAHGWLRMGVLWVGDIPVSAAMGFAYGKRLYLYNSGYDPAYAARSVGIAAVGLLLHDSAQEGLEVFDFLQGPEPYKYTLGAQDYRVYRAVCRREPSHD
jgi:CelD/BcsL family acetyltransferase involved in cellulose biosynthesis